MVHLCHVQCLPNLISAMLCCHLKGFWVVPPRHRVQQPAKLTLHLIARSLLVCTPKTTTAAAAAPTADQPNSPVQQSTKLSSRAVVFTAHKQRGRWEGPCPPHCLPSGAAGCCICSYHYAAVFGLLLINTGCRHICTLHYINQRWGAYMEPPPLTQWWCSKSTSNR